MSETWDVIFHRVCVWECCFESNASCFIILVHDVRFGCQWYGSRGWTFPPVFHCILLLCDSSLRGSLMKRRLTWKCGWNKVVELNSSMQKKWHSLTFTDICWAFVETEQGLCFSSGDSGPPPLIPIFTSMACRILFITGENA